MVRSKAILSLALTLLVLSPSGSVAQTWGLQGQQSTQPRRLIRGQQALNDCNIQQLSANEPAIRRQSEAGLTEIWDPNQQEFQCAGVTVVRHQIEPRGLLLPHYTNAPFISYIVQGRGMMGVNLPGCAETYESGASGEETMRAPESISGDRHQKVHRVEKGDVIALPAGVSKWFYNDGESPLTCVSLYDTNNFQNQLDQNLKSFFLAGSPHSREGGYTRHEEMRRHERGSQEERESGNNIFSGFDKELLADAFGVDQETIRRIQGHEDQRGSIIRVEGDLEFLSPEMDEEEPELRHRGRARGERERGRYGANGDEGTFCSARFKHNIDHALNADVFNPHGGRLTSLNSHKLPILNYLQLSAEKVHLYQNAILAPHWRINAHAICYVTRGQGRVQVANHEGRLVLDEMVQEGQLFVIPQNFAVVKRASRDGLEWVTFFTNDEAMISPLAGRISAIRAMPEEVVMNSYGLSREEARTLKYSRDETTVFSPSSRSHQRGEEYAIV